MKQLINSKRLLRLVIFSVVLVLLASSLIQAEGIDFDYVDKVMLRQPAGGDFALLASTTVGGATSKGGDYLSSSIIGEGYGTRLSGGNYIMRTGFQPAITPGTTHSMFLPLVIKN